MRHVADNKASRIAVFVSSLLVPGSGFVWLGKPGRGLMYVVWILFFGFLTYKASVPSISLIGRFSGGIAVWMLSLVELSWLLRKRGREG